MTRILRITQRLSLVKTTMLSVNGLNPVIVDNIVLSSSRLLSLSLTFVHHTKSKHVTAGRVRLVWILLRAITDDPFLKVGSGISKGMPSMFAENCPEYIRDFASE